MKPAAVKQIVRNRSAYRAGRVALDVLLIIELLGILVLLLIFLNRLDFSVQDASHLAQIAVATFVAVILCLGAISKRELMHSLFDLADCSLAVRARRLLNEAIS